MPAQTLTLRQLNRATLARQGLLERFAPGPLPQLVRRLGAIQAQHPDWPAFAIASRASTGLGAVDVVAARRAREVVRASLLRMTVHLVDADGFWPMSALTIGYRRDQFRALYKLDPETSPLGLALKAVQPAVLTAMRERPLAIAEIDAITREAVGDLEIPPHRAIWRHFSSSVPLVMVPFEGEAYGRARYLPAAAWLGRAPAANEAEAATEVARRYLAAFGPASVDDLAAFVGRGRRMPSLRAAVEGLGDQLVHLRDPSGRELVDLVDAPRPGENEPATPRLLARWDSVLLAYGTRDRARILPPEYQGVVITRNADVLPTFLVDGFVAGTWLPRKGSGGEPHAELRPFGRLRATDRRALEAEAERLLPALGSGAFGRYPGTD
jgi:hypothetical protein